MEREGGREGGRARCGVAGEGGGVEQVAPTTDLSSSTDLSSINRRK